MTPELTELQPYFLQWCAEGETEVSIDYEVDDCLYFDSFHSTLWLGVDAKRLLQNWIYERLGEHTEAHSVPRNPFDDCELTGYRGTLTINLDEQTIDHEITELYRARRGAPIQSYTLEGGTAP